MKRAETIAIARAWKHPQFSDVEQLADVVHGMENAVYEPAIRNGQEIPNRQFIVGEETGRFYGWATKKYKIAQNREAFGSLVNLIREKNIPVEGSMLSPRNGEFRAVLVLGDHYIGPDSEYKYVVEAANSYNGLVSWGALSAWIRAICENGMVSMKGICAEMHHRHVMDETQRKQEWECFLNYAVSRVDGLPGVIQAAQNQPIHNLEAMYRGAGFGPRIAREVIDNLDTLVPEQVGRPLTQWDGYNGLTKHFSNRTKGNYSTNMDLLAQASRMLEESVEVLEVRGLEAMSIVATP